MTNSSLNHAFRLVWNDAAQCYQAVPETARGRGKSSGRSTRRAIAAAVATSLIGACSAAWAGPTGGSVSAGNGSISHNGGGNATTVTQGSQNLAINWTSFSIGAHESVNFVQPNSSAIALNRVTGSESSVINGALNANGQVWILNANGVLFGRTASVNVGGLLASTLNLSDADFMAGKTRFNGDGSQGAIVNQGSLTGGYVALLGKQVRNSGSITTTGGTSALAAGDAITLSFTGNKLLSVQVDAGTFKALAENSGLIQADDGTVLLSATAKDALLDTVVNNTGIIQARGISTHGGRIELMGGFNGGTVKVAGTLDASSSTHDGGFIETSGAHVQIGDGAKISTLSATGKTGTWLVDPTDFTVTASSDDQTDSGIGADTLNNQLANTNVTLQTVDGGSDSGNINVNAAITWGANTTLSLIAHNDININAAITATGDSAGLALYYGNFDANGSASQGTGYNIAAPITLSGVQASLFVNSDAYTLIHSLGDAQLMANASGKFALAQDLDLSNGNFSSSVVTGDFSGTLAGLGHTISNLTIDARSDGRPTGLFEKNTGTIRDIGLVHSEILGSNRVGSLVGENFGHVFNAYATGNVTGNVDVGGLVGNNDYSGEILDSYSTANVAGDNQNIGGLVGQNSGNIKNVYATGSVTGTADFVGGLVGKNNDGGQIGYAYATGRVEGRIGALLGGLTGGNDGQLYYSYWDSDTTQQTRADGYDNGANASAVNSNTAYSHNNYADLGTWSETATGSGVFVATNNGNSGNSINNKQWVMIGGSTRPFLLSEYSTSIANANQLQLTAYDLGASYTLSRNIDASETSGSNTSGMWTPSGFTPVGNAYVGFTGSMDGASHTINDLSITRNNTNGVGLFGYSSGSISHLGLLGGSVSGNSEVGALVGHMDSGVISETFSTASVTAIYGNVGGLIGLSNAGNISNSYATGNVQGQNTVGGLVGFSSADTLTHTYATGSVAGSSDVGGLVGYAYYTGINASFWLLANASTGVGQNDNVPLASSIRGLSAAESKDANTYSNVGWSLATNGGSGSDWRIFDGYSMPLLRSFMTALTITTGDGSRVYDATSLIANNYTLSDQTPNNDFILGTAITSTIDGKNVGVHSIKTSGLYSVQQGYDLNFVDGMASISAATLSVSGSTTADNKTYTRTTAATVSGGSVTGLGSDDVTLSQSGTFSDRNVGSGKLVTYTNSLIGDDATNYVLAPGATSGTTTANISAKTITGSIVAAGKTYDGTTSAAVTGTLDGVIDGDAVTLASSGSFANKNAGAAKTVHVSGSISGTNVGNYALTTNTSTTADISAKVISAAIVADAKTYDGTTAASTSGTLEGVINGDTVTLASTGSFAEKNAGISKSVSVSGSISGADAGNYALSSNATTTAAISQAALTITANNDSKTADGTAYTGGNGVRYAGLVAGETSAVLEGSLSYGGSSQGASTAGSYTIAASGLNSGNYRISTVDGVLAIAASAPAPAPAPAPSTAVAVTIAQQQAVQQAASLQSSESTGSPVASGIRDTDANTGLAVGITRQPDGGMQFADGSRLLRVANGGLALPTGN